MTEALIAVVALAVGFGLGFLARGGGAPGEGRRKIRSERRRLRGASNGSSTRVRSRSESSEMGMLLESIEDTLANASEGLIEVRALWYEEGEQISDDGRAALGRFDGEVHALEERLDELETAVGADDPAHARLDAALNELFAAARRVAPYGQGEEADQRDRAALEAHEQRFATARADFADAAGELRSRSGR
jgi:hypothetical protein